MTGFNEYNVNSKFAVVQFSPEAFEKFQTALDTGEDFDFDALGESDVKILSVFEVSGPADLAV
jgi:hypothetical protein